MMMKTGQMPIKMIPTRLLKIPGKQQSPESRALQLFAVISL
jgi:hypothetical protein